MLFPLGEFGLVAGANGWAPTVAHHSRKGEQARARQLAMLAGLGSRRKSLI
jgi:hypothetical protein